MDETSNTIHAKQDIPILLKISAVLIIIMSITGFLFFAIATLYQFYDTQFLKDINIKNSLYPNLRLYVIIQSILHVGMLISALLILKLKKSGLYLLLTIFIALLTSEFVFENNLNLVHLIVGIFISFIIVVFYRRLE